MKPQNTGKLFDLPEGFARRDQIVYATRSVNIRRDPSASSEYMGRLSRGETLQRVGESDGGWSAVVYKDELCYISSQYLTTDGAAHTGNYTAIPLESKAGGIVTTNRLVNFRKGPAAYTTLLGQIPENTDLQRLGVCTNGWIKVEYKGMEGYVAGGYLTGPDSPPEETKPRETETSAPTETPYSY